MQAADAKAYLAPAELLAAKKKSAEPPWASPSFVAGDMMHPSFLSVFDVPQYPAARMARRVNPARTV